MKNTGEDGLIIRTGDLEIVDDLCGTEGFQPCFIVDHSDTILVVRVQGSRKTIEDVGQAGEDTGGVFLCRWYHRQYVRGEGIDHIAITCPMTVAASSSP